MDRTPSNISRRGLLAGVGGAAALLGTAGSAQAAPRLRGPDARRRPDGVPPGLLPISSPPEAGVSYRFAMWTDLTAANDITNGRHFQSEGVTVLATATSDSMSTCFELPPGARVHDVEAYYNANTNSTLSVAVWTSGLANLANIIASTQLGPFSGTAMHVTNLPVPKKFNGPYPHGSMLVVSIDTLVNQSIQVNGLRVGYKNGALATVLLPTPVRVYDSRKHTPITGGHTRKIPLAAHVPVGANGAQYVVGVLGTHGSGVLEAGPAGSAPSLSAVHWNRSGDKASGSVTTPLSDTLGIEVRSAHGSGKTDFTVDLVGYLV